MTFKEYYESTGPISLKDAISIIKKIDPEHDITKTYKAEATILKAVIDGQLEIKRNNQKISEYLEIPKQPRYTECASNHITSR